MFDRNYEKKKVTDDPGALPDASGLTPAVRITNVQQSGKVISGPFTQFQVRWTTSQPATTRVQWGKAPNMDQTTNETDVSLMVVSHIGVVSILTAAVNGQTILFRVHSRIQGGTDGMNNPVLDGYDFYADGSFVAI